MKTTVVLKVGGSVLSPNEDNIFDYKAALAIKNSLMQISQQYQFIVIVGGGQLAKKYQAIAKQFTTENHEIDWAGLSANNHNAVMTRVSFGKDAKEEVYTFQMIYGKEDISFTETFLLAGAGEPGHSGDMDALIMGLRAGSTTIISLKNVDGVYDSDPSENPNARKFDKLSWGEYFGIIKVTEFTPKMALPVDPITSKLAQEKNIKFIILDGADLPNLQKAIKGEEFIGTTIG